MTEKQLNREIYGQIQMAKYERNLTNETIADLIGLNPATLSNKSSKRELTDLSIWTVARLLKLNGKKLEFIDA